MNEIENEFKEMFFNHDKSRKTEAEQNEIKQAFIFVLKDLEAYKHKVTLEMLKEVLNADEKIKEYSLNQINKRLSLLMKRNGLKLRRFHIDRKASYVNHLIVKDVIIPQYEKNNRIEVKKIYPNITEKTFIFGDTFLFKGDEKIKVGYPVKRSHRAIYHAIEL